MNILSFANEIQWLVFGLGVLCVISVATMLLRGE